ncbi:MAG: hypothetical protein HKP30_18470, partial [Myxococcales bacterium]|nr:hypothetical protein [Myxococcales bacterium]
GDAEQRLAAARSQLEQIGDRAARVAESSRVDPEARNREERDRLRVQLAQIDEQLAERAGQLITPEQMVRTLREVLAEQQGLRLERFELMAPVSAIADPEEAAAEEAPRADADEARADLYKHAVEIEWVGGYRETLRYLRAVERLGWSLYWERLDYQVIGHPDARVRLRLFTLSEQEDWIGV